MTPREAGAAGPVSESRALTASPAARDMELFRQVLEETQRPVPPGSHRTLDQVLQNPPERQLARWARELRLAAEVSRLMGSPATARAALQIARVVARANPWLTVAQILAEIYGANWRSSEQAGRSFGSQHLVVTDRPDFSNPGWVRDAFCGPGSEWYAGGVFAGACPQPALPTRLVPSGQIIPNDYPFVAGTVFAVGNGVYSVSPFALPVGDPVYAEQSAMGEQWKWTGPGSSPPTGLARRAVTAYPEEDPTLDGMRHPILPRLANISPLFVPWFMPPIWRAPGPTSLDLAAKEWLRRWFPELAPGAAGDGPSRVPSWPTAKPKPEQDTTWRPNEVIASADISIGAGGAHLVPPSHQWKPVSSRTREQKVRMPAYLAARFIANVATESWDLVRDLWQALPSNVRNRRGRLTNMLADLYNHWDQIDWREALYNIHANSVQDSIIGQVSQNAMRNWRGFTNPLADVARAGEFRAYGQTSGLNEQAPLFNWIRELTDSSKLMRGIERDPIDRMRLERRVAASGLAGQQAYAQERARQAGEAARRAYRQRER